MADSLVVYVDKLMPFGLDQRASLGECRICQDEDSICNLETPCSCRGTLMVTTLTILLLNVYTVNYLSFCLSASKRALKL